MAPSTTDESETSPASKVSPTLVRIDPSLWSRFWGKARGRIWQNGIVGLVGAAIVVFLYWRIQTPVDVQSHQVRTGEIVGEVMGTGTVATHVKVTISSKITGLLTEVLFDQGDQVKSGQVVARLDDRDVTRQVKIEEANVNAHKATVERLIADKNAARSTLDRATNDFERAGKLLPTKAITKEEYDRYADTFNVAKAGMDRAEAAILEGQKQLVAAEETLEYQKAMLAYTVIAAPFDGLIVRRDCDPGNVVVPGTSILYLVSLKEVWVSAWVDETKQGRIKPGQLARVVFRSEPSIDYPGSVVRIGRETDPETREFLVDVQPAKYPEQWSIGQRAEVFIETERKSQATLLPSRFLARRGGKTGVFVAIDHRAQWRKLQLGIHGREFVEIFEGLTPGEIIVTPADPKSGPLTDGTRITLP